MVYGIAGLELHVRLALFHHLCAKTGGCGSSALRNYVRLPSIQSMHDPSRTLMSSCRTYGRAVAAAADLEAGKIELAAQKAKVEALEAAALRKVEQTARLVFQNRGLLASIAAAESRLGIRIDVAGAGEHSGAGAQAAEAAARPAAAAAPTAIEAPPAAISGSTISATDSLSLLSRHFVGSKPSAHGVNATGGAAASATTASVDAPLHSSATARADTAVDATAALSPPPPPPAADALPPPPPGAPPPAAPPPVAVLPAGSKPAAAKPSTVDVLGAIPPPPSP